ncbi:MAG: ATP-binding protein [Muribaculaceae bacterium]|nr:ATP-binding protein [Muribaculaceae bacterium]
MKMSEIKNQVVLMCGISGSGKTHYARQLEKEGFIRLSTDSLIWEKVGAKVFNLSKEKQKGLFAECKEQIRNQLNTLLKSGQKVVVDATHCKRSVRDEVRNLCAGMGTDPVFVFCCADKKELWHRLSQRKGSGPDDLIVTEEQLNNYWQSFEPPQEDENDFLFLNENNK